MDKKLTKIDALGEFGLIKKLSSGITLKRNSSVLGIGDDAAVADYGSKQVLISTDMRMEGVHFDLVYVPLKHLGYKSVVINLSDIYAMNGTPEQVTVSIALSSKFSLEAAGSLYGGIKKACDFYNVDLLGGDTSASLTGLCISITAIGSVEKENYVKRSDAKKDDLICVSGDLGAAYLGLQMLEREKKVFLEDPHIQPKLEEYEYLIERQLKPEARRDILKKLNEADIRPNSMIDLSDGLASDIRHICEQSHLGCKIYEDKLPIHPLAIKTAEELRLDPSLAALNGGEDYEICFTVPVHLHKELEKIEDVHIIGHMSDADAGTKFVARNGVELDLDAQGWKSDGNVSKGND